MFNKIDSINLIDGLNMNPISLETGNEITTAKWLMAIQDKLNKVVSDGNAWQENSELYTDAKVKLINDTIVKLTNELKNGDIVKDGSLDINKMSTAFIKELEDLIVDNVDTVAKFVTFGLDDNGNFIASIPKKWNEVKFDTSVNGNLILEY